MYGLAKKAGFIGKVRKFTRDFTGKNEKVFHQNLLDVLKKEKEGKAKSADVSNAMKFNSLATEDKYKAHRQGTAGVGVLGAAGLATASAIHHKKKKTRLEAEEGL